ncbi:MAG: RnfABCDGE type electron transport complex subunit G [Gammaproteobacteria bacterium]
MTGNTSEQPLSGPSATGRAALGGYLLVVIVAAGLVGGSWWLTRDQIANNATRQTRAMLAAVLPASLYDNHPDQDVVLLSTGDGQPLPVYLARLGGIPTAAALTVIASNGFGGPIKLLVGIDAAGTVLGVSILEQHETPGIGDAIEPDKSTWIATFTGRSLADSPAGRWGLKSDGGNFDAIAGATVSSRAVVSGVRQAVEYFAIHKSQILASHESDQH